MALNNILLMAVDVNIGYVGLSEIISKLVSYYSQIEFMVETIDTFIDSFEGDPTTTVTTIADLKANMSTFIFDFDEGSDDADELLTRLKENADTVITNSRMKRALDCETAAEVEQLTSIPRMFASVLNEDLMSAIVLAFILNYELEEVKLAVLITIIKYNMIPFGIPTAIQEYNSIYENNPMEDLELYSELDEDWATAKTQIYLDENGIFDYDLVFQSATVPRPISVSSENQIKELVSIMGVIFNNNRMAISSRSGIKKVYITINSAFEKYFSD